MLFSKLKAMLALLMMTMTLWKTSDALKCYTCVFPSTTDDCGPNFNAGGSGVTEMECPQGSNHCVTTRATSGSTVAIVRGCSSSAVPPTCETQAGAESCAYTCNTDLCNDHLNFNKDGSGAAPSTLILSKSALGFLILVAALILRLV